MTDDFKYQCRRRSGGRRILPMIEESILPEVPFGAGSGGDASDGGHTKYHDGTYGLAANAFQFSTRPPLPPASPGPYVISLFSPGSGTDGRIEANASQGVRVTAGMPQMPAASSAATKGVEIEVGTPQEIYLHRDANLSDQRIRMMDGEIQVYSELNSIVIQSAFNSVILSAGPSSITLGPSGIVMKGPLIQIN